MQMYEKKFELLRKKYIFARISKIIMDKSCGSCMFFVESRRLDISGFLPALRSKSGKCSANPGYRGILSTSQTMNCDFFKNKYYGNKSKKQG